MSDLQLDPLTGDLLVANGEMPLVTGIEYIGQKLLIRWRFIRGEWYLDQRVGFPYRQRVWGRKPDEAKPEIESLTRQLLLTTPGVVSVDALSAIYDGDNRVFSINWKVTTETGFQLTSADLEPFIIEVPS